MKILLGLLLSFNALNASAAEYLCAKDTGFLGINAVLNVFSGSTVDAPSSFEYPKQDPGVHTEQTSVPGEFGGSVYSAKSYVVTDLENVNNTNDITLKLVSYADAPVYICEKTAVPYQRCVLKSVVSPNDNAQEALDTLKNASVVNGILLVPGVGSNTFNFATSFENEEGIPPFSNVASSVYVAQSNPPRTYEEVRFPKASGRSQKYYCKAIGSINAIGNGQLNQGEFIDTQPQIILDDAPSGASQQ